MSKRIDERHSRILASLLKLSENKKCFDCSSKVNVYANLFNSTFICERCSGLHRELNHRVKSISASTFTPDEIAALQKGGNGVAKTIWLATWSRQEYPEPDSNDSDEVRQFMRAKYHKKLWHIDGNSTAPPPGSKDSTPRPSTASSTPRPSNVSSPSAQASPSSMRSATSTHPNIAVTKAAGGLATTLASTPERTLSRKSSTLSTDSGSTNLSKSTDQSSAGSSPFHPGFTAAGGSSKPSQPQLPSSNLGQYSFNQFHQTFGAPATPTGHNPHQPSMEDSDPFSLMQASFSNMQVSGSPQPPVPTRSYTAPAPTNNFGTFTDFESAFSAPSSQQPPVPTMSSSTNDFFSSFHQTPSAATASTTFIPRGPTSSSSDSAAFNSLQGHAVVAPPSPMITSPNPLSPMTLHSSQSSTMNDYFASNTGAGSNSSHTGGCLGARSFDDFLSSMGSTSTTSTTTGPATTDISNPFGLPDGSLGSQATLTPLPPALQRAHTSAYPSSTGSNASTNNPFAAFARSAPSPSMTASNMDLQDPFGQLTRGAASSPFASEPSTPRPHGASSPNPFSAAGISTPTLPAAASSSPFVQERPIGMPGSSSSHPQQMLSSSSSSLSPSSAFFTVSSVNKPPLTRTTTEPAVSHFSAGSFSSTVLPTAQPQVDDVFGTWATKNSLDSPGSASAAAAFGLTDLDPFGNHHRHASSTSTPQPISTNPFGLY